MYNELIDSLHREILINKYNEKLIPFWLGNLKSSEDHDEDKQKIILKVNEMYKKAKVEHHSKVSFLFSFRFVISLSFIDILITSDLMIPPFSSISREI